MIEGRYVKIFLFFVSVLFVALIVPHFKNFLGLNDQATGVNQKTYLVDNFLTKNTPSPSII